MNRKITLTVIFCAASTMYSHAQNFSLNSTPSAQWVTVKPGIKPQKENVLIQSGHTVTLDEGGSCAALTIEKDAVLKARYAALSGKLLPLTIGRPDLKERQTTMQNDGIIGALNGHDAIALKFISTTNQAVLTGTGATYAGSIGPVNANTVITIDQDLSLNNKGAAFDAAQVNTRYVINQGRKVTLGDEAGINAQGKSTVDVNGTLTTGKNFTAAGDVAINIADGALVDATKADVLNVGHNYFITRGNGALVRRVETGEVFFPVGAEDGNNINGISLTNTGAATNFRVSARNAKADQTAVNDNQWQILADQNASGYELSVSPMWTGNDGKSRVTSRSTVSVLHLDRGSWKRSAARISGAGRAEAPYRATADGFTTDGMFAVAKADVDEKAVFGAYPNPAVSRVTVSHPAALQGARITVTTLNGRRVSHTDITEGTKQSTLNVSHLERGIYIVQMDNSEEVFTTKIIKE